MARKRHTPDQILTKLRDELLGIELFTTLAEARYLADQFRENFNHRRPHSSLDMRTPAEFAAAWRDAQADSASAA